MNTKTLVVGQGGSTIHEFAVANALNKLGHHTKIFFWERYFLSNNPFKSFFLRIQNKFLFGPAINKLNTDLIEIALTFNPQLIFIYRGTHVTYRTISFIKKRLPDCIICGYNNDDPFSTGHFRLLWRHFLKSIQYCDLMFAYRRHNISEYYSYGAKRVELLMPWFIPEKDFPSLKNDSICYKYDVIFVGHYEKDDRINFLKKVADSDFSLGIFGPDWSRAPKLEWLAQYQPIRPLLGSAYREEITSAKIALCLLSKLNRDTYTRRCFELPAMGVFMMCQYTEDLAKLFEDGVDVVFFHNPSDMMEKISYYLKNNKLREQIAANGRNRVVNDGHDVVSRMDYVQGLIKML